MSSIAEILERNDTLCMDDVDDRASLAMALRIGLVEELRNLAASSGDDGYGIEAAAGHIELMSDD